MAIQPIILKPSMKKNLLKRGKSVSNFKKEWLPIKFLVTTTSVLCQKRISHVIILTLCNQLYSLI